MKNYKSLIIAGIAVVGIAFASCSKDGYWDAASQDGETSYAFNAVNTTISYGPEEAVEDVAITITRSNPTGDFTLPVNAQFNSDLLTCPESVEFKDGEATADYIIVPKADKFGIGTSATAILTLDSIYHSEFGSNKITVKISKIYNWHNVGTCTYTDDFMTTFYSVDNEPYGVMLQECDQVPGYYRLVNAYGKAFPYNEDGDWDASKDWYMEVHAENPDKVWIPLTDSGMDWGYGNVNMTSYIGYLVANGKDINDLMSSPDYASKFGVLEKVDGTPYRITFPYGQSLLINMPGYSASWYYANSNGAFEILFPGFTKADYSLTVSYDGRMYNPKDEMSILSTITLGADIASAGVLICPEGAENECVQTILAGGEEVTTVSASGQVALAMPYEESGKYSIVAVGFDAEGEAQVAGNAVFKYTNSAEPAETFTPVYVGTYTYSQFWEGEDEGLVLSMSDDTPGKYRISNVFYGVDFDFILNGDGTISFEEQSTGYVHADYGEVFVHDMYQVAPTQFDPSFYSDGTFNFSIGYAVSAGYFGRGVETFTLTGEYASGVKDTRSYLASPWKNTPKCSAKNLPAHVMKNAKSIKPALIK